MVYYMKISKAEFKCPNCFPIFLGKLLCKMLDSNPNPRISVDKIKQIFFFFLYKY
ncbi:CBL-interacting kinase [Medicago truncatula]|uniref:CBL-interacting kinase n=1 Tax=Medicago truncatula TaxID=3880 RepID=G7IST8_MEDTR|nr:CBL-interacting kinase [Medicago truncatula]